MEMPIYVQVITPVSRGMSDGPWKRIDLNRCARHGSTKKPKSGVDLMGENYRSSTETK